MTNLGTCSGCASSKPQAIARVGEPLSFGASGSNILVQGK